MRTLMKWAVLIAIAAVLVHLQIAGDLILLALLVWVVATSLGFSGSGGRDPEDDSRAAEQRDWEDERRQRIQRGEW